MTDTAQPETDRAVLSLRGADSRAFLQDLVSNDLDGLDGGIVYAALLTPQGKYRADFFVIARGDEILLDVARAQAPDVKKALTLYRLRRKIEIAQTDTPVSRGTGPIPDGAHADPRTPEMGWRGYDGQASAAVDWDALRVAAIVPAAGIELTPDSYILEMAFERLNGVDFRKGCYVGQEVIARMKHKTDLRKGLAQVAVDGAAPVGTEIVANGKTAGVLHTQSGGAGLAYLRFDRAGPDMMAGDARVHWHGGR